jgi:hypothetical protein
VAVPGNYLPQTTVTLLGQPILHTAFGALGGFLGTVIWKPPFVVQYQAAHPSPAPHLPSLTRVSLFTGPVAWGRVVTGTALTVGGTIWANVILELLLDASENTLCISSDLQARLVTWEVTALAMLVGSGLAGSCTTNSLKQGLCVGLATATILAGLRLSTSPSTWFDTGFKVLSSLILSLAGAWFGGSLFPPVIHVPKRRGLGPEGV